MSASLPATSLRLMGSTSGGSGLPSTSETRSPSPPIVCGAQPIPQSVSDSAVERETPRRQRVSLDGDRRSSTSPRPSKHSFSMGSRTRIQGCCRSYTPLSKDARCHSNRPYYFTLIIFLSQTIATYRVSVIRLFLAPAERLFQREHTKSYTRLLHSSPHKQGHSHSPKVSQTQKNSAESSRSRTGSPVRSPSPSRAIPAYAHSSTVSPHSVVSVPRRALHTHRSLPLSHPSAGCQPIRAMLRCAHVANTRRQGHRRGSTGIPVRHLVYVRMCAVLWPRTFPQRTYIRFRHVPRQFYLHAQLRLPSLYFSLVLDIFQEVSLLELQRIIDVCQAVRTESAISHDGHRLVIPGGLGSAECLTGLGLVQALMGGFRRFVHERVEDA
jgi:hypothetical protein